MKRVGMEVCLGIEIFGVRDLDKSLNLKTRVLLFFMI